MHPTTESVYLLLRKGFSLFQSLKLVIEELLTYRLSLFKVTPSNTSPRCVAFRVPTKISLAILVSLKIS